MKRIISLLLLICLVLPATAFAEQHEYVGSMMVVNCKKEVSLRAEPTTDSERLDWVPYHVVLENCWSGYGEYYYVEYDGLPGYIHSDYLEVYGGDLEDAYAYPEFYEWMQIVGCPEWTPLRAKADVTAKQIAQVPLGAVVYDCVYYGDDFTFVNYDGMEGYVLTEYITLGDSNEVYPELSVKYVTNCEVKVSLRAEPTSESKRLAWVPKNTAIEALGAEDGYFYVYYNGEYGYIFGDYLADIDYIGDYVGDMVVTNCSKTVPLFEQPAPEFGVLTTVPKGTVVKGCYEAHDGYYSVGYDDYFGYIHGDYLEAYTAGTGVYLGSMQVVNCDEWVSLRAQPSTKSERLLKVSAGVIVTDCYTAENGFIYVEHNGRTGYIMGKYLEKTQGQNEYLGDMQVVKSVQKGENWIAMFEEPGFASELESAVVQTVPVGEVITDCVRESVDYVYGCYDGVYGYVDILYLQPFEGRAEAGTTDPLRNYRIQLGAEGADFGVYLISDSTGGEWSMLEEKHHLKNTLRSMPMEWWPIAMTIPEERIIEIIGGGELYLIIPTDPKAEVTVNRLQLGYDGFTGIVEEELYHSESGEPILLRCNENFAVTDCEIIIVSSDGSFVRWYPSINPNDGRVSIGTEGGTCLDFTEYEQE